MRRYDLEASAIKASEIAVVSTRARLVRVLRELIRVSSLLPFPIQSWWLRAPDRDVGTDHWSLGLFGNIALSLGALASSIGAIRSPLVLVLALAMQIAGGVAYHAVLDFERGPHRRVRRIWEVQIALAMAGGVYLAVARRIYLAAAWWFLLGLAFVVGLYLFERYLATSFERAALE